MRRPAAILLVLLCSSAASQPVVVGSKTFTESYLLAEMMAQMLESRDIDVERRFGFGGTLICFEALRSGEIDLYPEYTGTIAQTILRAPELGPDELGEALAGSGLRLAANFGFDNSYALAVTAQTAERLGLERISNLGQHPELRIGLSHEFRERPDGWPGLRRRYALPQQSSGIEHGLAYQALTEGGIDVTDAYTTDGDLRRYNLVVLEDDRDYFPSYLGVALARASLSPAVIDAISLLDGRLEASMMRLLNAEVAVEGRTFAAVAEEFLREQRLLGPSGAAHRSDELWRSLAGNTLVHLKLTGLAIAMACVFGIGLALAVYRSKPLSRSVLYIAGLLQTIPSIALLALMIPFVGVGQVPAIIALFLYSLLPIARNSITALVTIDPLLRRVASALGLTHRQQLRHVYVPLALPHVLAGLRTAAVVSIGTATLAAFIGAGGLGEPIVTGLALNDTGLILQGAIPAALLALTAELMFEGLERWLVPRHLMAATQPAA